MQDINNLIGTQASFMMTSRLTNFTGSSNSSFLNTFYTTFISLFFSSILITVINYFREIINWDEFKKYANILLEKLRFKKRDFQIILSSRRYYNKYGRMGNDITNDKLSVLYYLQKNISKCGLQII